MKQLIFAVLFATVCAEEEEEGVVDDVKNFFHSKD